jgi:hypothetical protein
MQINNVIVKKEDERESKKEEKKLRWSSVCVWILSREDVLDFFSFLVCDKKKLQ